MVAKQLETPLYLENIPNALRKFDRWSPWRAQWNDKRGKWDKIPQVVDNLNHNLSTNKVKSWVSFDHVVKSLDLSKSAGLGFVMTGIKGLVAIDLDNCIGEKWALDVIAMVNSYTEISPSGKGYRIFAFGDLDTDWNNHEVGIEVYGGNEARFLTVTGNVLNGSQGDVAKVSQEVFDRLAKLYAREKRKAEIIDLNMPELIDDLLLPSTATLRIPAASLKFLLSGEFDLDRSGALFGVGVSLYAAGFSDAEVFSILAHNEFALEVALDHRRQDYDRALLYLWREHCCKAKVKGSAAIITDAEFDIVESAPGEVVLPNFKRDGKGLIEATIQNVTLALKRPDLCGMEIKHDRFRDEIMFTPNGVANAWRTFTDADYSRLRITLETGGFKPVGRELIRDVVLLVADDHPFDSAILWLDGLKWDGVPRVERFLETYFGAGDSPYTRAVSMYIWTALAGRVMSPGIKADMVPILVGEQGAKKSSAVAAMAPNPDFFTEVSFHERDEDLARKMRGRLIAEIGELRGLHTRELESIKAFITRTHENWVPKYREFATSFPRRLVFIGTTNQDQFLADDTGNRRWCPVRTNMADIDAIKRDRLQLWAEGRVWFDLFGVAFQDAERLAQDVHEEHTITEPWADSIADWLDAPDALSGDTPRMREFLQVHEVARDCLQIEARNLKRVDQLQIRKILRVQGYESGRVYINGKQVRALVKNKAE